MKRIYGCSILIVLISLCLSTLMYAQTEVSGTVNGDSAVVWTLANSPYIITGSTTISDLDTVEIESGVEVRFNPNTQLTVTGVLVADGVTFTANSGTTRESWNRIYLNASTSRLNMSNSTIQFATHGIEVTNGQASLTNVTISDSKYGIYASYPSEISISESAITGTVYPIYLASEASVSYSGTNDFSGNDNDLVIVNFSTIDSDWTLNKIPVPYFFNYSTQVYSGYSFTIASGTILKFDSNTELYTQDGGVIHAVADVGEEIHFTSWKNDNAGGDTNNDGNISAAGNTDWYGIRVNGNTAQSTFKRVRVTFAGYQYSGDYRGGITLDDNNSEIDSSIFQNNLYGAVLRNNADAVFTNNTIGSSGVVPVALTFDSDPVFSNNEFSSSNNQYDAIGLIGTTIQVSSYLPKRNFTKYPNVTYLLLSDLYVDTGADLTIEEGVVIKSTSAGFKIKGTLTSVGTSGEKIVFTSVKDDNVGNPNDTNKDGNNTAPSNTDWQGLAFGTEAGASVLDYNQIRYASFTNYFYYDQTNNIIYPKGAVNIINSNVTVTNSEIANTSSFGIDSRGIAKPVIMNNSFSNTGSVPVALSLTSDPTFSGNTLANVGLTAIGYHGETITADGIIRNRDFAGYDNITTVLLGTSTVASGSTLTIEPGTVIKVDINSYNRLLIEGALRSVGKPDSIIYFTSVYDNQIGNPLDTNGDGDATIPSPDNWGTIRFLSTTDDAISEVSNTEIRYSKHGMIFTNAAPKVDRVMILSCRYMGFGIESGSNIHISNSTIQNCEYDPVAISTNSTPTFENITFNSNGSNGVGLLEANFLQGYSWNSFNNYAYFYQTSNVVSSDATLSPYSFAGYTNLPFIMRDIWSIGQNATLTVTPSVIFKGYETLTVDGALKVLGTSAEPVIFTSVSDDGAGGDSNNDGNTTAPAPGQSIFIRFNSSSLDTANRIQYAEFRYPQTALEFESADGLIENSLFQLSNSHAVNIFGNSSPDLLNNNFQNINGQSIYMDMFSSPVFSGNVESNIRLKGLGIRGGTWGSDATLPFRSFAGTDSITYILHGDITIPSGSKIIVPGGMSFKAYSNYGGYRYSYGQFSVDGTFKINGTESLPVVFTIDTDDRYGRPTDTYTDGQSNDTYQNGTWIVYNSTSDDTSNAVEHAIFSRKTYGITANSANPGIYHSVFQDLNYGINLTGVSAPFVEYNEFKNLDKTPMLISLVSYPQTTVSNVMSGKTWQAIGVRSETLVQDVTLPKRNFGGKIGIPYYMSGNYTIGTGAILSIDPGVILKFENYAQLDVQKGLLAQGNNHPDSLIIFTHIYDDFYGGDTNADSSASINSSSYWYGIKFSGTSLPGVSLINHSVIKGVRYNYDSYAAILADNASPTITNSIIKENGYGVIVYGSGNPVVTNNDIYNNSSYGIYNRDKTFTIDAANNWWGSNTGPTHAANVGGEGDKVTDGVNYTPFKGGGAASPVLGDVSLNGKVQSYDASVILQHMAFLDTMNVTQLAVADVSGSGGVSSLDASYILQYVVGLIDVFPVELMSKARQDVLASLNVEGISLKLSDLNKLSENQYAVKLELSNTEGLYAFDISLSYPDEALNVEEIRIGDFISDAAVITNISQAGKVLISVASGTSFKGNGSIAELIITTQKDEISTISIDKFIANEMDYTDAAEHEEVQLNLPEEFELYQNYPNPFNPTTTIRFNLAENNVKVNLIIYNVLGQKVKTLVNEVYQAGRYRAVWDGTNDAGMPVSTGVYIYRIQAGDIVQSKKLTFIK